MAGGALRREFPDLPPVWAIGAAALAWALARWLPLASLPAWPAPPLGVAGVGLAIWSAWWFRVKRTPIEPRETPRALIVEGPYRLNRNPIYTGMALVLLAWAFWLGAATALLPAIAFPLVIDRRFVRSEEAALRAAFGPEVDRYFAATRRW
jgi:protein-S-isoprenylcysteine O-methyltransferase Ste14